MLNDRYVPGWGADAPFSAAAALARRGRTMLGIGEVSYPDNFRQATNPPDEAACARIRAVNDPLTVGFGKKLIAAAADPAAERPFLRRHLAVRSIMAAIGFMFREFGRRVLAKSYIADASCTGCGLCARVCPARSISLRRGRPRWAQRCVACNRCINLCPSGSIKTSTAILIAHMALSILIFAFALTVPLPRDLVYAARIGARGLILIVLTVLQLGPIASGLLALSRVSALRGFFESSFMAKFRRYRDPGFHPET
jgi:ferredoxin